MPYARNIISLCTWNVLNTALELKFLQITIIKDRCHYASLNSRIYIQRPFKLEDLVPDILFCTLLWNVTFQENSRITQGKTVFLLLYKKALLFR